jgi:hypothetical protein
LFADAATAAWHPTAGKLKFKRSLCRLREHRVDQIWADDMIQPVQTKDKLIEVLCLRLFPKTPTLKASIEILIDENREKALAYLKACEAYEVELRQLSDTALLALDKDENEHNKRIEKEDAEREENDRFFFELSARADYMDWTQRECWTVDEATALLLGKDPAAVDWNSVNPLVFKSRFAKRYADLRQQIKTAQASGEIPASNTPEAFLHFAHSAGFVLPAELETVLNPVEDEPAAKDLEQGEMMFRHLIDQKQQKNQSASCENEDERLDARSDVSVRKEYELLLRIFHAIAVSHYGFEKGSNDMSIAKSIVAELEDGDLHINLFKVLKLLNDAADLPPNQIPQD